MSIDPKGFHYFLVVVELSRCHVNGEPIKDKTAHTVLRVSIKIYCRGRITPSIDRIEVDSGKEFDNAQFRKFFLNTVKVLIRYGQPGRHRQ